MRVLPQTHTPRLRAKSSANHDKSLTTIQVACARPCTDPAAFAKVLRTLLGGTGEFAFRFEANKFVLADGLDEGQSEETLTHFAADEVTGHESIEAALTTGKQAVSAFRPLQRILEFNFA